MLHSLTKLVTNENAIKIAPAVVGISFHGDER